MGVVNQARRVFCWDDYRTWDDGERRDLLGGDSFLMSPAPTSRHQSIVGKLFGHLFEHFRGQPCELFVSPIDVKLSQAGLKPFRRPQRPWRGESTLPVYSAHGKN